MQRKVSLYTKRRYWYHVSTTLRRRIARLTPWDEQKSTNRGGSEPSGSRICVAPTIEQCLVAVPYSSCERGFSVYRTKSPVLATRPSPTAEIFDWKVTREGWLLKPTTFIKIGSIRPSDIRRGEKIEEIIGPAACCSNIKDAEKALKWWKNLDLKRQYLRRV